MNISMKNEQHRSLEMPQIPDAAKMIIRQMDPGLPMPDLVSYYALENDRKLYLDDFGRQ